MEKGKKDFKYGKYGTKETSFCLWFLNFVNGEKEHTIKVNKDGKVFEV